MENTSKDYIETINFKYFKTYSFQRKGKFNDYDTLFDKYINDNNSLSELEAIEFKKLRNSNLFNQKSNYIFNENNQLNETAELIHTTESNSLNIDLIEILKIPFFDYEAWMCTPIYRDAILFYDSNNTLLNGLNICFECCNIIDLKHNTILTDNIVYEKLKAFLQSLGHEIK